MSISFVSRRNAVFSFVTKVNGTLSHDFDEYAFSLHDCALETNNQVEKGH